ncbi:hypothetical protein B0H17DRAFT_478482 [Mycena rosella]|uniref:Uncharacterized protein n=1 Tax=Mycena rosella TaxID=1033263 RepID=A0AAD7C676_MYCRO|nr:hypothetical protein B0H17DRAFT_478482 [Mycena rosella]
MSKTERNRDVATSTNLFNSNDHSLSDAWGYWARNWRTLTQNVNIAARCSSSAASKSTEGLVSVLPAKQPRFTGLTDGVGRRVRGLAGGDMGGLFKPLIYLPHIFCLYTPQPPPIGTMCRIWRGIALPQPDLRKNLALWIRDEREVNTMRRATYRGTLKPLSRWHVMADGVVDWLAVGSEFGGMLLGDGELALKLLAALVGRRPFRGTYRGFGRC